MNFSRFGVGARKVLVQFWAVSGAQGQEVGSVINDVIDDCLINKWLGKNDMAIIAGLVSAAVIMAKAHAEDPRSIDDFKSMMKYVREVVDMTSATVEGEWPHSPGPASTAA